MCPAGPGRRAGSLRLPATLHPNTLMTLLGSARTYLGELGRLQVVEDGKHPSRRDEQQQFDVPPHPDGFTVSLLRGSVAAVGPSPLTEATRLARTSGPPAPARGTLPRGATRRPARRAQREARDGRGRAPRDALPRQATLGTELSARRGRERELRRTQRRSAHGGFLLRR